MSKLRLRLPATSANLGPGFDALGLALELFLEMTAQPASEFSIAATGRNVEICGALKNNLLLETYRKVLADEGQPLVPLEIKMENGIPLGMGCGSSAAASLAGVALAVHFGDLGWSSERIMEHAASLEGHPDNVAACWLGGFTIAAGTPDLTVVSIPPPPDWRAILALPSNSVSTAKSRAVLPGSYSRKQAVANLQNVALLTAAFALRQPELLPLATQDQLHQPYRRELCPLLDALAPLAGKHGIGSVTLSGAGPAVLILGSGELSAAKPWIADSAKQIGTVELIESRLSGEGASVTVEARLK